MCSAAIRSVYMAFCAAALGSDAAIRERQCRSFSISAWAFSICATVELSHGVCLRCIASYQHCIVCPEPGPAAAPLLPGLATYATASEVAWALAFAVECAMTPRTPYWANACATAMYGSCGNTWVSSSGGVPLGVP